MIVLEVIGIIAVLLLMIAAVITCFICLSL